MANPDGQVYEQFLGKVIKLTDGHRAKVEEKPEVRKAGELRPASLTNVCQCSKIQPMSKRSRLGLTGIPKIFSVPDNPALDGGRRYRKCPEFPRRRFAMAVRDATQRIRENPRLPCGSGFPSATGPESRTGVLSRMWCAAPKRVANRSWPSCTCTDSPTTGNAAPNRAETDRRLPAMRQRRPLHRRGEGLLTTGAAGVQARALP